MQSNNGNFEKYKSEMLRMYQQKNRPINSSKNSYLKNDQENFYDDSIKSNDNLNSFDNGNDFSTQISDNIRLGDDFPPVAYSQDISPHTVRGDSPIEYDSEGKRTSDLVFEDVQQSELDLRDNARRVMNEFSEMELTNNFEMSQNSDTLQGDGVNLESILPNQNYEINFQENVVDQNVNMDKKDDGSTSNEKVKTPEDWINFENRNTSNGFLKVQVYSAKGAFPLKDARVIIFKELDNQRKIFYEMVTDESGITQPVSLPAPDASHSFVVDGIRPYENYNIEVSKQGFQTTLREGLPIFPGVVSLQPIQLRPLLASERDNKQ